jgi:hypothetical protein
MALCIKSTIPRLVTNVSVTRGRRLKKSTLGRISTGHPSIKLDEYLHGVGVFNLKLSKADLLLIIPSEFRVLSLSNAGANQHSNVGGTTSVPGTSKCVY